MRWSEEVQLLAEENIMVPTVERRMVGVYEGHLRRWNA